MELYIFTELQEAYVSEDPFILLILPYVTYKNRSTQNEELTKENFQHFLEGIDRWTCNKCHRKKIFFYSITRVILLSASMLKFGLIISNFSA